MKIVVDGFGGDNAPLAVLQGCEMAVKEYSDIEILITGDTKILNKVASEQSISMDRIEFVQANGIIEVEDDPTMILKEKRDCSMGLAFQILKDGRADVLVCAGSTGAIVTGATLLIKRIKGIRRAALAPILPTKGGCYMLLDGGANLECKPEMLQQFAVMGSVYMNKIVGIDKPRVALVNVGAEETKGTSLQKEAYQLLKSTDIHFIGNTEVREVPNGECDVVVADGFSGNIILKLSEGFGKFIKVALKGMLTKNAKTKLGAMLLMNEVKAFSKEMDYKEYGGAPLMGVQKPVIKAHGSSDGKAFKNAIRQGKEFYNKKVIEVIQQTLQAMEN